MTHSIPNFDDKKFLNPLVTVDIVLFTIVANELKVLTIERDHAPFKGKKALPGGFLLKSETTEKAAERILKEKAGISNVFMEQLYTFDTKDRDPRGPIMSVTYLALAPYEEIVIKESKDTQHPSFEQSKNLKDLAFDHKDIIDYAVKRVRAKLEYTNVVYSLLPEFFSFSDLQNIYEIIFGREFDKRNFRKKFLQLGFIKKTDKLLTGYKQRPASLYTFKKRGLSELDKFV